MNEYYQDIKIICQNSIMKGYSKAAEGHPWRNWKIRLVAVDNYREKRGKLDFLLDHVEYHLHPTFDNPRRVTTREPYLLQEKGWGEFDMRVELFFKNNLAPPENIFFDLHFREPTYTILHKIIFQNPSPELIRILSIEIPDPPPPLLNMMNNNDYKKRRTSPPLPGTKKIKTPPSTSDVKYPSSPSSFIDNDMDDVAYRQHGGYRPQRKPHQTGGGGGIVDDIYSEKDIPTANPIHSRILDEKLRNAWGLPEGLDMLELAKRLSSMSPEQTQEVESIILNNRKEDMLLEENDDEFMVDLYSLGSNLLNILWDYTEKRGSSRSVSSMLSPFSLVQANTNINDDD